MITFVGGSFFFYESMGADDPRRSGGKFEPQGHSWQGLHSEPLCIDKYLS